MRTLTAGEIRAELAQNQAEQDRILVNQTMRTPLWLYSPGTIDPKATIEREDTDGDSFLVMGPFTAPGLPPDIIDSVVANTGDWWYVLYVMRPVYDAYDSDQSTCPAEEELEPVRFDVRTAKIRWTSDVGTGDAQKTVPDTGLMFRKELYDTIEEVVDLNKDLLIDPIEDEDRRRSYEAEDARLPDLQARESELLRALEAMSTVMDIVLVDGTGTERHIDNRSVPSRLMESRETSTVLEFMQSLGLYKAEAAKVFYGDFIRLDLGTSISDMLRFLECQPRNPPKIMIIEATRPPDQQFPQTPRQPKRPRGGAGAGAPPGTRMPIGCAPEKDEYNTADAAYAAQELNVDTRAVPVERLRAGMNVEAEHGVLFDDGEAQRDQRRRREDCADRTGAFLRESGRRTVGNP